MLEKIPVGGWRHAESRVVEVFAGKAKARDVVPNWPRGRSTSKRLAAGTVWPWLYAFSMTTGELLHVGERIEFSEAGLRRMSVKWEGRTIALNVSDPQMRQMDAEVEQAEERRKSEMMEGWHLQNRRIIYDGFSGLAEWVRLMYVEPDDVGLLIVGEAKP